jgi:hypothetical protein
VHLRRQLEGYREGQDERGHVAGAEEQAPSTRSA